MNILITGGSSGLGKALVAELAKDTTNYVSFTFCNNEKSAEDLLTTFSNTKAYKVDFSVSESLDQFVAQIESEQIDVLINNAYSGNPQGTYFHKTDPSDFATSFNNNIIPLIRITQACICGMRKRKFGKIINVLTSYVIDLPPTGFSIYSSTKGYIRQLSKSLCKEYARFNITSNCVLPEYMHTSFGKVEDFQLEQMVSSHPLKRLLKPEEVAVIINHIIHSSQQLNGVEIPINAAQHIL